MSGDARGPARKWLSDQNQDLVCATLKIEPEFGFMPPFFMASELDRLLDAARAEGARQCPDCASVRRHRAAGAEARARIEEHGFPLPDATP